MTPSRSTPNAWQPSISRRLLAVAALALVLSLGLMWGAGTLHVGRAVLVPGTSRVGFDNSGTYIDFTPGTVIPGFTYEGDVRGFRHPARATALLGLVGVVAGVRGRSRVLVRGALVFSASGLVVHSTMADIAGSPGPLLFIVALVLTGVGTGAFSPGTGNAGV